MIDGRDASGAVVRNTWMLIDANDVTVAGFTMRYANDFPLAHWGALRIIDGRSRTIIRDCDLSHATYADMAKCHTLRVTRNSAQTGSATACGSSVPASRRFEGDLAKKRLVVGLVATEAEEAEP